MQGPGGHCHDELGRGQGEGEGLVGEGDLDGRRRRRRRRVGRVVGEAVDVQGRVPGGGDEDVVPPVVEDGFDARGVGGEDRLRAGAEVDSVNSRKPSILSERKKKKIASRSSQPTV